MGKLRSRRAAALLVSVLCVVLAVTGCRPKPPFYIPPDTLPTRPGEVVRSLKVLFDKKYDVFGTAVMYGSTTATGEPNVVTGSVYVPKTAWTGPGSRPIVSFAPGTQGLGDRCAPTQTLPIGKNYEQTSIKGLLDQGWAVAITDYEKLGPPGDHTYVVKDAEAHATLDVVRAALRLPDASAWGIDAASPVGLWGYSQGGQAAAGAAEIETAYAPELNVQGVVAGGVPSDLGGMIEHLDGAGNQFFAFLAFAAVGLNSAYPELDLESYLNDEGAALFADNRDVCLFDGITLGTGRHIAELTTSNPLDVQAWQDRIAEQQLGSVAPTAPVFLYHGSADQIVPTALGQSLRTAWCGAGAHVLYREYPVDHLGGIAVGLADGVGFLTARFAGEALPATCTG
jgi:pimeloyl-ACP methyl ester carboxylesterase/predicted small lipoprotein YifL